MKMGMRMMRTEMMWKKKGGEKQEYEQTSEKQHQTTEGTTMTITAKT